MEAYKEALAWWNDAERDRFALLKKYGYQDRKKPWKYRPLTDKGIHLIWYQETKPAEDARTNNN